MGTDPLEMDRTSDGTEGIPRRLLIVDDNQMNIDLLVRFVRECGYEAESCSSGADALDTIVANPPDLVLLDINMPEMDGYAVLEQIRGLYPPTQLPVLMVTARNDSDSVVKSLQLGANDYIQKPVDYPVLLARLDVHLRAKRAEQALARANEDLEAQVRKRTGELQNAIDGLREEVVARTQAESRLQTLNHAVEQSASLIVITDRDGQIEYVNPHLCRVTGYEQSELIGQNPRILKSGAQGPNVYEQLWDTITRGDTWKGEFLNRKKSGETYWSSSVISPVHGEDGRIAHFISVAEDVTESKRMFTRVRDSEAALAQQVRQQDVLLAVGRSVQEIRVPNDLGKVVDTCYGGIRSVLSEVDAVAIQRVTDRRDVQFEAWEVSSAGSVRMHSMASENLGRIWREGAPLYRPRLDRDLGGLTESARDRISSRYGLRVHSIFNVPMTSGILSILSGRPDAFSGEARAFLEQVAQMISVGISRVEDIEKMDAALKNLPDGVSLLDGECVIRYANPAAQMHLGLLGVGGVGAHVTELGGMTIDAIAEQSRSELPLDIRGAEPDRTFEVSALPLRDGASEGQWVLMTRDVTAERDQQARIQRQYRMASVGQLAAGVAHDFNNLLSVITGLAQIMELRDDIPSEVREDLQSIFEQGNRAAQLVRQILDFSRQSEVERAPVDVLPFLKEAVKMIERVMPTSVRLAFDYEAGPFVLHGNLTQLQQVLNNIAINAQHAMPNGGDLSIRLRRIKGDEIPVDLRDHANWVEWTFSDTGVGMPAHVIEHVFEPFFTTKPVGEGTGLGLAQCDGIVQQHGGCIEVDSREGVGTTLRILLPLLDKSAEEVVDVSGQVERGDGQTILLVEDDDRLRHVIATFLTSIGYDVCQKPDGQTAMLSYTVEGLRPDVIVSDYDMPNLNGVQMIEALREAGCAAPAICITGYKVDEEKDIGSTFNRVMNKPVTLGDLARAVADASTGGK